MNPWTEKGKDSRPLNILLIEDTSTDAELIDREIRKAGFKFEMKRVQTKQDFLDQLEKCRQFDLILSDYKLPQLDGMTVLKLRSQLCRDIPLIMVTSSINEETAVECMKLGADDYVIKEHLFRLGPVMEQVLEKAREREERIRAEKALKESERKYRTLVETAKDIIFTLDPENRITSLNPAFEKITGWNCAEWIGQTFLSLLHPDDVGMESEYFLQEIQGKTTEVHEVRIKARAGNYLTLEKVEGPQVNDGRVIGVWGIGRDVTLRKAAEEEIRKTARELSVANAALEQADRDLEQFAFVASHDLQEPLRTVTTYAQLLQKSLGDQLTENQRNYVKFLKEAASRMRAMIDALLTYARTGQGRGNSKVDCNEVVDNVLFHLRTLIDEAGARVNVGPLPTVCTNKSEMEILFQNLVSNALKYRHPGQKPEVEISASKRAEDWIFEVKDNGIGFDMQYADQIFKLFHRLHAKDEYPGTGIGLGLCKKIVEHHGGRIWAESKKGEGSRFFFTCCGDGNSSQAQAGSG